MDLHPKTYKGYDCTPISGNTLADVMAGHGWSKTPGGLWVPCACDEWLTTSTNFATMPTYGLSPIGKALKQVQEFDAVKQKFHIGVDWAAGMEPIPPVSSIVAEAFGGKAMVWMRETLGVTQMPDMPSTYLDLARLAFERSLGALARYHRMSPTLSLGEAMYLAGWMKTT